jgi:hypothetical protein
MSAIEKKRVLQENPQLEQLRSFTKCPKPVKNNKSGGEKNGTKTDRQADD